MQKDISSQKKYENYKEQFKRLNKALANGFNLEAMFIEYAIIEDRTESILYHAGRWENYLKTRKGRGPTLHSKVTYIKKCAKSKISLLDSYFQDEFLDEIIMWKDERNRLIHALLKQELAYKEVPKIAERGNDLAKTLRNRVRNYNRAINRKNMNSNLLEKKLFQEKL